MLFWSEWNASKCITSMKHISAWVTDWFKFKFDIVPIEFRYFRMDIHITQSYHFIILNALHFNHLKSKETNNRKEKNMNDSCIDATRSINKTMRKWINRIDIRNKHIVCSFFICPFYHCIPHSITLPQSITCSSPPPEFPFFSQCSIHLSQQYSSLTHFSLPIHCCRPSLFLSLSIVRFTLENIRIHNTIQCLQWGF